MKKIIRLRTNASAPDALNGLHPVLAHIYAARGVQSSNDLIRNLQGLHAPQLKGMEAALDLLEVALKEKQRILVVGDFDADGATSTVLAVLVLLLGVREPERGPGERRVNPIRRENIGRLGAAYWWVVALGAVFTLARFSEAFLVLRAQQVGIPVALVPLVMVGST